MSPYILIIMVMTNGFQGGTHITHIPFGDKALCEAAAQQIHKEGFAKRDIIREAHCFQRDKDNA